VFDWRWYGFQKEELPPLLALELVYYRNCFNAAHLLYFAKLMPFTPASGSPLRQLVAFPQTR
jgi:hypothetical protein